MDDWQSIKTAPKDGTPCWIVAKHYLGFNTSKESNEDFPFNVFLCRYDSWNCVWRTMQAGKNINRPEYLGPFLWQPCVIPDAPKPSEFKDIWDTPE